MGKRRGTGKAGLPDWHLWVEVSKTVSPLHPPRHGLPSLDNEPLPLPAVQPPPADARPARFLPSMPPYQSTGRPAKGPSAGIEPGLKQRVQRGRIEIDGTLDLHGMRQVEAHAALNRYIKARWARGDRTLLVITGKGLKKLGDDAAVIVERGVLRAMLPVWLSEPGLAPLIAGWDVAAQGHGGDGAFYVRLRREREYR
jgi:DNA-nicking Smr family endonuclease